VYRKLFGAFFRDSAVSELICDFYSRDFYLLVTLILHPFMSLEPVLHASVPDP
jgi:hypothetical protein